MTQKKNVIEAHAIWFEEKASDIVFTRESLEKAWDEFKKHGDLTVYLNFDKTKPVGKILVDQSGIDDEGLKLTAQIKMSYAVAGHLTNWSVKADKTVVKELELHGINLTHSPFDGAPKVTFPKVTINVKESSIIWLDNKDHYCPCNGDCHEKARLAPSTTGPCSLTCMGHHSVYGGKKE